MDKVKTHSYTPQMGGYYGGDFGGRGKGKGRADHLKDWQYKPGQGKGNAANEVNGNRLGPQFNRARFNDPSAVQRSLMDMSDDDIYADSFGYSNSGTQVGTRMLEFSGLNTSNDDVHSGNFGTSSELAAKEFQEIARSELKAEQAAGGTSLGKSSGVRAAQDPAEFPTEDPISEAFDLLEEIVNDNFDLDNPAFAELCVTHGPQKAMLFSILQNGMAQFAEEDDMLRTLISDQFQLLSSEAQSKMVREIFELLPPKERESIEQNGL